MVSSVSCIELVKLRSFSQMSNKYVEIDPGEQRTVVDLVAFSPSFESFDCSHPPGMRCSAFIKAYGYVVDVLPSFLDGKRFP